VAAPIALGDEPVELVDVHAATADALDALYVGPAAEGTRRLRAVE
jgi:hypothetical protein